MNDDELKAAEQAQAATQRQEAVTAFKQGDMKGCATKLAGGSVFLALIFGAIVVAMNNCNGDSSTSTASAVVTVPLSVDISAVAATLDVPTSAAATTTTAAPIAQATTTAAAAAAVSPSEPCSLLSTDEVSAQLGLGATASPAPGSTPDEHVCAYDLSNGQPFYVSTKSPFTSDQFTALQAQYGGTTDGTLEFPAFRTGSFISQLVGDVLVTVAENAEVTTPEGLAALHSLARTAAAAL